MIFWCAKSVKAACFGHFLSPISMRILWTSIKIFSFFLLIYLVSILLLVQSGELEAVISTSPKELFLGFLLFLTEIIEFQIIHHLKSEYSAHYGINGILNGNFRIPSRQTVVYPKDLWVKENGTSNIKMLYSQLYVCCFTLKFPAFLISSIVIILYVAKITYIVEMGIKTEGT